jgi:hypothetical protein
MQYIVHQLPAHLFWDSDLNLLNDVEHYDKIIVQSFERGDIEQMALVIAYYGEELCREILKTAYYLPERAMLFASLFLSIEMRDFEASKVKQHHTI